jgi:hypothetical protein
MEALFLQNFPMVGSLHRPTNRRVDIRFRRFMGEMRFYPACINRADRAKTARSARNPQHAKTAKSRGLLGDGRPNVRAPRDTSG